MRVAPRPVGELDRPTSARRTARRRGAARAQPCRPRRPLAPAVTRGAVRSGARQKQATPRRCAAAYLDDIRAMSMRPDELLGRHECLQRGDRGIGEGIDQNCAPANGNELDHAAEYGGAGREPGEPVAAARACRPGPGSASARRAGRLSARHDERIVAGLILNGPANQLGWWLTRGGCRGGPFTSHIRANSVLNPRASARGPAGRRHGCSRRTPRRRPRTSGSDRGNMRRRTWGTRTGRTPGRAGKAQPRSRS